MTVLLPDLKNLPEWGTCFHVEGVDGSGKSTLVEALGKLTTLRVIPTDDPPSSWAECVQRIERRLATGIVCDRSSGLVSELVYGPVLRRATIVDESVVWGVVQAVLGAVTFVYCRPPDDAIRPRTRRGESRRHVRSVESNLGKLLDRYDRVMMRIAAMGGGVVWYDRTRVTIEELIECAELPRR